MNRTHITIILIATLSTGLFAQDKPSIDGIWFGTLKIETMQLRLGFTFSESAQGKLEAILTSIDQGNAKVPMDEFLLAGDTLTISHPPIGLKITGMVDTGNQSWDTEFTQGPAKAPILFKKVDKLPE